MIISSINVNVPNFNHNVHSVIIIIIIGIIIIIIIIITTFIIVKSLGEFNIDDLDPDHGVSSNSTCVTLRTCIHGRTMIMIMMMEMMTVMTNRTFV